MGFLPDSHLGHLASALMSTIKANLAFKITFLVAMVTGMVGTGINGIRSFLNPSLNFLQVNFGANMTLEIILFWLPWRQIGCHGNQYPSGNSAPCPDVPAKFGAHRPINDGGDAEQTNPMKIQIIVWWHTDNIWSSSRNKDSVSQPEWQYKQFWNSESPQ